MRVITLNELFLISVSTKKTNTGAGTFHDALPHHHVLFGSPWLYSPAGVTRGPHDRFTGRGGRVGSLPQGGPRPGPRVPGQRHPGTPSTFLQAPVAPRPPQPILPPSAFGPLFKAGSRFLPSPTTAPFPSPLSTGRAPNSSCPERQLPGNAAYLTRVAMVTVPRAPVPGRRAAMAAPLRKALGPGAGPWDAPPPPGLAWLPAAGDPRPPSPPPFGWRRQAQAALPALPYTVSGPLAAPPL